MSDLERAYNALSGKSLRLKQLHDYYEGDQKLVYSAERLSQAFGDKFTRFNQNWCSVVVDTTLDRMKLVDVNVSGNSGADKELDTYFADNDLSLMADEVHKEALISEEAFVIVWPDINNKSVVEIYPNPAHLCHLFYRPENPKIKEFAAKWFKDLNEFWHITLYYADRIEYYITESKADPTSASAFKKEKVNAKNPFGVIPVFHFRCPSDLENVITVQDAINKLFADMMVASEFSAFKQRWVISNADISTLKNSPNEIWNIPGGDGLGQGTAVGEFSGEELTKWINSIDKLANYIAIATRTPKNYLADVGAGISGDALIAMEAPLVKKVEKREAAFARTWKEIIAFVLKLKQFTVSKAEIEVVWGRIRSEQPLAEMQAVQFGTAAGIPVASSLRWQGKSKAEIAQMETDKLNDAKASAKMSKILRDQANQNLDQNNDPGYGGVA
jgi:hypothetical protein